MRFSIIANLQRPDASDSVIAAIKWCLKNRNDVCLCEDIAAEIKFSVDTCPRSQLWKCSDVIVSMGGDGTILASVRAIGEHPLPILGINLGSLGFLTQITGDRLEEALERVAANRYIIEERMVLKTEVLNGHQLESPFALNDVVIDRGNIGRVINLSLYSGGDYACSYTADGLIVSTPTGSTAYSLAVGGPILYPDMKAIIVTPIAPFSLTSRPLIFPSDKALEIRLRSEHGSGTLTIDGQVATDVNPNGAVRISRAGHSASFIRFEENSFYDILRRKLHWGKLPVVDHRKSDFRE